MPAMPCLRLDAKTAWPGNGVGLIGGVGIESESQVLGISHWVGSECHVFDEAVGH